MATQIHPTAIVESGAVIGDGCGVGPSCMVGPQVRVGAGTILHSHVVLDGKLTMGEGCNVYPFACLGKQSQDLKDDGGDTVVEIGDRTVIREYVTVNQPATSGLKTTVGSDCLIQSYCHIAHDCQLGDRVIMSSYAGLSGHVEVGDRAIIGGQTGVVQFVRIGRGAYLGGAGKVTHDILPFAIADGTPAVIRISNKIGMARAGHSPEAVIAVKKAIQAIITDRLSVEDAETILAESAAAHSEVEELLEFLRTSKRGIARPRKR
jgi:UDP-N-acetylglucosamine acyltransferase